LLEIFHKCNEKSQESKIIGKGISVKMLNFVFAIVRFINQ